MNAISLLKSDHRNIEVLFREFEAAGDRVFHERQEIARKVCTELEIHSQLEEQLFYPAVEMTADPRGHELVRAATKEHHIVQALIDQLNVMSSAAETFDSTFRILTDHVEHHIREEERELLPGVRSQLGHESLEYLGDQMLRRRRELTPADPLLLRDTLRQAKSLVTMVYGALTGVASAKPLRRAKPVSTRRVTSPKPGVHAKTKLRAQAGHSPNDGRAPAARSATAKAKGAVKKGAAKDSQRRLRGTRMRTPQAIGTIAVQKAAANGRSVVPS